MNLSRHQLKLNSEFDFDTLALVGKLIVGYLICGFYML